MGLLSVAGVQVDIMGNLAPLRRDLQTAERELSSFARTVSGTGTGAGTGSLAGATTTANTFFNRLRSGAQDIFFMTNAAQQMYAAFSKPFRVADDLAQMGFAAERSRIALTNMLGSAAEYDRWMRAIKTATHGTISEMEAAGLAYQSLRLGLATTADEAQEFIRVATIIGAASPQLSGTADAISEIGLTIANMSWRRLDQLGLSVSEVKARMEELMDLNANLTQEEAFQQAVMEGLTEQANMLGDELIEVGAATQRWKVVWNELKTDIGWKIGEGFDGAIIAAESLYEILRVMTQEPWKMLVLFGVEYEDAEAAGVIGDFMLKMTEGAAKRALTDAVTSGAEVALSLGLGPSGTDVTLTSRFLRTPPVGIPDPVELMRLAQIQMGGGSIPIEMWADIQHYYDAYYAAQERAQTAAFQRAREQSKNRLLRMYGTGGGMNTLMFIAGLELSGTSLSPEVRRSVDAYYDAYYEAQERAITQAQARSRSRVTRYLPNYKELGAAATGPLPQFPESSYLTTLGQHGGSLAHIFARGLGLPTDRSGVPRQDAYQEWYWQQYYTQGGWQGGDVQPWQIDPATRRAREQIAANQARYAERYAEQQRMAQMRAFREADAASMADIFPGGGRGPYAGLSLFMGAAQGLQTGFDVAGLMQSAQALQEVADKFAAIQPGSLAEKFGIDPSRLDTDVLNEMADALDRAGVNTDVATEALKIFKYQTGITTPTAELFTAQVDLLAQKLADGEITAADFATQMTILRDMDLSGLESLFEADIRAGEWEKISAAIQGMAQIDLSALRWMSDLQNNPGQDLSGLSRGVRHGTEGEAAPGGSVFSLLALDAENALSEIQRLPTEGVQATQEFAEGATSWFATWSSESLTYIDTVDTELANIEDRIARLTLAPFVVTLTVNEPGDGGDEPVTPGGAPRFGGRPITPFATGGYTGDGPPGEVAGLVHRGEYVVPRGGALVLERNSGGSSPTIVVQQLNTFGDWRNAVRQLEQAAQDAGYRLKVR